jgi:hypothetical protein
MVGERERRACCNIRAARAFRAAYTPADASSGIESSCDETGVALVETHGDALPLLRSHALHSQIAMHQAYGGVVPELASRDHHPPRSAADPKP